MDAEKTASSCIQVCSSFAFRAYASNRRRSVYPVPCLLACRQETSSFTAFPRICTTEATPVFNPASAVSTMLSRRASPSVGHVRNWSMQNAVILLPRLVWNSLLRHAHCVVLLWYQMQAQTCQRITSSPAMVASQKARSIAKTTKGHQTSAPRSGQGTSP